jgi:4-hydroxyacetophenone monooxygenase
MAKDIPILAQALADAHRPSLLMSLVHLSGDASLLSDEMKPAYDVFADGRLGGYSPERQTALRERAKEAIGAYLAGDGRLPPAPAPATLRRMMDFIAGGEVPERYVDMLNEELALDGVDQKKPQWEAPRLKVAAAKLKVLIVGAGMPGARRRCRAVTRTPMAGSARTGLSCWSTTGPRR